MFAIRSRLHLRLDSADSRHDAKLPGRSQVDDLIGLSRHQCGAELRETAGLNTFNHIFRGDVALAALVQASFGQITP